MTALRRLFSSFGIAGMTHCIPVPVDRDMLKAWPHMSLEGQASSLYFLTGNPDFLDVDAVDPEGKPIVAETIARYHLVRRAA